MQVIFIFFKKTVEKIFLIDYPSFREKKNVLLTKNSCFELK